MKACCNN